MVEFKRILVPLDGSPLSESALPIATSLAGHFESQIILIRALGGPGSTISTFHPEVGIRLQKEMREHARQEAESHLQARQGELRQQGFKVRTLMRDASPAESIIDAAAAEDVDLIVMSTHGRGGLARWTFGSVADKVARHSPCPVLLVRQPPEGSPLSKSPKQVGQ